MAGAVSIAVLDLDVQDPDTDEALLETWIGTTLTIAHVYGWNVAPISNSRFRYTVIYD